MRVLERASTLVPSCVREATFVVLVCRLLRRVRLGVVGHRGAGAWFWHLVPLLLKVLLHNRAYHGGP